MFLVIQGYHVESTGECGFRYSPLFNRREDAQKFLDDPPEEYFLEDEVAERVGDIQELLIVEIPLIDIGGFNHNWVITEAYL